MSGKKNLYRSIRIFIPVVIIVIILFLLAGYFNYKNERTSVLDENTSKLNFIALLKEKQISNWNNERLAEAKYIQENNFLNDKIRSLVSDFNRQDSLTVYKSLYPIYKNHDYHSIIILNNNYHTLINLNPQYKLDSLELKNLKEFKNQSELTTCGIKRNTNNNLFYYDIFIPIYQNQFPVAAVVMVINPEKELFTFAQSWYIYSETGESFLLNKENDSVVFVSPSRFKAEIVPLNYKVPISSNDENIIQAIAAKDFSGIVTGLDYRGEKVLADVRKVEGTPWYLLTKQDFSEILSPLIFHSISAGIFIFLIGSLFVFGILYQHNKQRLKDIEKIKESELKYQDLVEQATDGIVIFNNQFRFMGTNSIACKEMGYSREEFLQLNLYDIFLKEDLISKPLQFNEMEAGKSVLNERRIVRKDKSYFFAEMNSRKLNNGNYLSIVRNITERKNTELLIKSSEQKFRNLFEKSNDAIFLIENKIFIDCNPKTEEMFGTTKSKIIGKTLIDFSPENQPDNQKSGKKIQQYLKKVYIGESQLFEWVHLRNNIPFYAEINLTPFELDQKKLLLAIVRDISERKKFETELITAKEKAEEMNKLKSSFLANMSHELRTPMVGILGFSEILAEEIKEPGQKAMANDIYSSGKRLLGTLNSILDLSRIESSKFSLAFSEFDLNKLVKEEVNLFRGAASSKNVLLDLNTSGENFPINSDVKILRNIISNLINNAVKFTQKGNIIVKVNKINEDKADFALITITDTGIGIPSESQEIIFEEFRQVSEGVNRGYEGTGLGLTLTKKFTELLNGCIYVKSEPEIGSEFSIKIPVNTN